jgi:phage-related tail fiber protein
MQKIGSSTSTANGAGEYTEGSPGSGVDATLITAAWLNTIQRELVNLIQGASLTLNPADDSQVFKAVQALQTAMSTWSKITGKPTTVAGYGITDAFTKPETTAAIQAAVSALVASSPAALDTLKELASALGNDPNFATTMTNLLAGKLAVGQFGLGGTSAPSAAIDAIGLPGGFHYFGDGPTSLANNVCVLNIPYGNDSYAAQIAFRQGFVEPEIYVRGGRTPGVWGSTRKLWHTGNLDPNVILPVGTSIQYSGYSAPPGFLKENGAAVSRTAYADLFAVIGTTYGAGNGTTTFNLPDSRGEFIRGLDDGRGVDPGRTLGTAQADQMQSHRHGVLWGQGGAGSGYAGNNLSNYSNAGTYQQVSAPTTDGTNGEPRVGTETRPRNVARLMCIKY